MRGVAFACRHRHAYLGGERPEGGDAVGRDRVLHEQRAVTGQFGAHEHGVGGRHVAVQLDAEIDVPADGLADGGEALDEITDPLGLAHAVVVFLEEQDLQGRVALVLHRGARRRHDLLQRPGVDHPHGPDSPAGPPAQELPHRNLEMLATQVPQGLVDGADGARDRHPAETQGPVERQPVVLDVDRVLALQEWLERPDDLGDGGRPAEEGRLAHPRRAVLGRDPDIAGRSRGNGLHGCDAHGVHLLNPLPAGTRTRARSGPWGPRSAPRSARWLRAG